MKATAEQAVVGADVVLALTSSPQPILKGEWLSPQAMVCAIGAATPDRRELDEEAMRGAVVVESREAAMKEAGDIVLARAQVRAEIGELLNGAYLIAGTGRWCSSLSVSRWRTSLPLNLFTTS